MTQSELPTILTQLRIGLIEWNDITGICTEQVMSTKFLLIDIANPEKYIGKAKNIAQKKLMKANMSKILYPDYNHV